MLTCCAKHVKTLPRTGFIVTLVIVVTGNSTNNLHRSLTKALTPTSKSSISSKDIQAIRTIEENSKESKRIEENTVKQSCCDKLWHVLWVVTTDPGPQRSEHYRLDQCRLWWHLQLAHPEQVTHKNHFQWQKTNSFRECCPMSTVPVSNLSVAVL